MQLVVLYGLPGCGKSSLARALENSGYCWPNTVKHAEYGNWPMAKIVSAVLDENPQATRLVVEGVMPNRAWRVSFVRAILKHAARAGRPFKKVVVFHMEETLQVLSSRRNRGIEAYEQLRDQLEVGSSPFPHCLIDGATLPSIAMRLAFVGHCLTHVADLRHYSGRGLR